MDFLRRSEWVKKIPWIRNQKVEFLLGWWCHHHPWPWGGIPMLEDPLEQWTFCIDLWEIGKSNMGRLQSHSCVQYGNYRIFLPLRIYVNSTLVILKPWISNLYHFCSSEFWIFGKCLPFSSVKFPKIIIWSIQKLLEWQFLTSWNQPKLISRKIKVAKKFVNFHIVFMSLLSEEVISSVF